MLSPLTRRGGPAALALAAAFALSGPAAAQTLNPTVGTYQFFFTDTNGVEIATANTTVGGSVTVQVRLRETGGNVFATGISGYDTTLNFTNTFLNLPTGTGFPTDLNLNAFNPNPYATPADGFDGNTGFRNSATATANASGVASFSRTTGPTASSPTNWVRQTTAGNAAGSILLYAVTFNGIAEGTATLSAGDGLSVGQNFGYDINAGGTISQYLDSGSNGTNPFPTMTAGAMQVIVAVPEPATTLGVAALALALTRVVRRQPRE
jgi:hypothetical protein